MTKKKQEKKPERSINKVIIVLITVLSLMQILLSNRIATWGKQLESLEQEIKKVEEENLQLGLEISNSGRLYFLAEKAKSLGFIENPEVINLSKEIPVVLKPSD